MVNHFLPVLYALSALILLFQAIRVMSKGFSADNHSNEVHKKPLLPKGDRTGQVTIHPEILNQDGDITDEDLLTVRFSTDNDPPKPPK
mgnify:CR=1 FL=1